jgi:hypothetical protein
MVKAKTSYENLINSLPLIITGSITIIATIAVILFSKFYLLLKTDKQKKLWQLGGVLSSSVIIIGIFSYIYQYYSNHSLKKQSNSLNFTELTKKGVLDLELFFMNHNNELENLYYEMYGSYGFPKPKKPITLEQRQIEFHAVSYMVQVMEDVYTVLELEIHYDEDDYLGWMNTFKKWGTSKTFINIWHKLNNNYGLNFVNFVEKHIIFNEEESEESEE